MFPQGLFVLGIFWVFCLYSFSDRYGGDGLGGRSQNIFGWPVIFGIHSWSVLVVGSPLWMPVNGVDSGLANPLSSIFF